MAEVPANEKLYAMVVTQAKQRYRIYPSPGASHWVHRRYLELGGQMIDSEDIARRKEAMQHFIERRRELREKNRNKSDNKDKKSKKDN
jgi:hypothetical protein